MIEIFPIVIWVGTFPLIIIRRWIVQVFLLQKLKNSEKEWFLKQMHSCNYIPDIPAGRLLRRTRHFDREGLCGGSWPWFLYKPRPRTQKPSEKLQQCLRCPLCHCLVKKIHFPYWAGCVSAPRISSNFKEKEEQISKSHRHPFFNDCVGAVWQIAVLYELSCWSWLLWGWIIFQGIFLKVCAALESRSRCSCPGEITYDQSSSCCTAGKHAAI